MHTGLQGAQEISGYLQTCAYRAREQDSRLPTEAVLTRQAAYSILLEIRCLSVLAGLQGAPMRCLAADKGNAEMLQSCKYGVSFESALMLCGGRSVGRPPRSWAAYRGSVVMLDCIQPSVF